MLVFQNKGMAAIMVYQTNPPGIDLYFYANTIICFSNPIWLLVTWVKMLYIVGGIVNNLKLITGAWTQFWMPNYFVCLFHVRIKDWFTHRKELLFWEMETSRHSNRESANLHHWNFTSFNLLLLLSRLLISFSPGNRELNGQNRALCYILMIVH